MIDAGLIWIGPDPATIDALGDKVQARRIALKVGAPLVAGTEDPVNDASEVVAFAEQHGLPIAIKAAFGGGGRGLKVAWKLDEVAELYESAVREAVTAFGRGECFVERFLDRPRHIEAQIIADRHGRVVVVGTRDCSLQRRNQKLIEEAPAPYLNDELRQRIHESARAVCAEAGYVGAGTVEFLLSGDGTLSFPEVNTRLQVEHPVTEETSGVDTSSNNFASPTACRFRSMARLCHAAIALNSVSTLRTRATAFCRRRGLSLYFSRRPVRAYAWTPALQKAQGSHRTSTR